MERHDLSTHDADPQEEIARLTAMMGYEENMQRAEEEHYDNEPNYAWELLPETIGRLVQRLRGVEAQLDVDENGETLADRYRVAMEQSHAEVDRLAAELAAIANELHHENQRSEYLCSQVASCRREYIDAMGRETHLQNELAAAQKAAYDFECRAIRAEEDRDRLAAELAVSRKWARRWKAGFRDLLHWILEADSAYNRNGHHADSLREACSLTYMCHVGADCIGASAELAALKAELAEEKKARAAFQMYGMMWEQAERENAALKALCREGAHNVGNYANYAHALQVQSMRVGDSSAARRWQSVENEARNLVSRLEAAGKEE